MEILLSQSEADAFIAMPKVRTDETEWDYPISGAALAIPLCQRIVEQIFSLI
jgi:hypothetical protein